MVCLHFHCLLPCLLCFLPRVIVSCLAPVSRCLALSLCIEGVLSFQKVIEKLWFHVWGCVFAVLTFFLGM